MNKLLLVFLVLFTNSPLMANEFIYVVTEELRPLNYEENGRIKGSATEIVRKVLEKAGASFQIKVYPWARAYSLAQNKKNILIYTINRTKTRESKFKWIGLVHTPAWDSGLYKLKNNSKIVVKKLDDAKKYRIGAIRNDVNHEFLIENGFARVEAVGEPSRYIEMLIYGRIDMIIGSYPILVADLKKTINQLI